MKHKNVGRILLFSLGILLLLASGTGLLTSQTAKAKFAVDCEAVNAYMEAVLPRRTAGIKEEKSNHELPLISYEGQDYACLLSVPSLSVKVPVRAAWDKNAVRKVPCVFTGDPYTGTLIIGGTDAAGQFDFLSRLDARMEITVTDMKGHEFSYTVTAVRHAKNAKAETLTDEDADLTLFAKDRQTGDWLLARCRMK